MISYELNIFSYVRLKQTTQVKWTKFYEKEICNTQKLLY